MQTSEYEKFAKETFFYRLNEYVESISDRFYRPRDINPSMVADPFEAAIGFDFWIKASGEFDNYQIQTKCTNNEYIDYARKQFIKLVEGGLPSLPSGAPPRVHFYCMYTMGSGFSLGSNYSLQTSEALRNYANTYVLPRIKSICNEELSAYLLQNYLEHDLQLGIEIAGGVFQRAYVLNPESVDSRVSIHLLNKFEVNFEITFFCFGPVPPELPNPLHLIFVITNTDLRFQNLDFHPAMFRAEEEYEEENIE